MWIMEELEALGNPNYRKIYANHGVGENQFGVGHTDLKALAKKIKRDHAAARELWATGNNDARILACMIADPQQATHEELEAWVHDLDHYGICDAFGGYVAQTPHAQALYPAWIAADHEWIEYTGWNVLGTLVFNNSHALPQDELEKYLHIAEANVHTAKNRVRHGMNAYIINVGLLDEPMRTRALEAAERVGDVDVNHGKTSCITPNAKAYIHKTLEYRANKAAKPPKKKA